jgi:3-oxoacyl-[acyl-carrier-protein] synthase-3
MRLAIRATAIVEDGDMSSIHNMARAANAVIAESGLGAEHIAVLINTGVYRDKNIFEPAVAAIIQKKAGINASYSKGAPTTLSFDLMNGACGTLNAIQAARALLAPQRLDRHAIILSGDTHPSLAPVHAQDFPFTLATAAMLLSPTSEPGGFGKLHVASSGGPIHPEGYLQMRDMGTAGRSTIVVDRPASRLDQLLPLAVKAARSVLCSEPIDLDRTLLISSRPTPGFADRLAEEIGSPAAVHVAPGEKDPHTSAIAYGYHTAQKAGLLDSIEHILFVAAGGGPTAAAISYRPEILTDPGTTS